MSHHAPPARAILAAVVWLGGCLLPASPGRPALEDAARLEVQNDHWEDLTIFLERDGTLHRLGVAAGHTTRVLTAGPELLAGDGWVRLVAKETGRQVHAHSEIFLLPRGQTAVWRTGPSDHVTGVIITP